MRRPRLVGEGWPMELFTSQAVPALPRLAPAIGGWSHGGAASHEVPDQ
jgi:hypothetical protein